MADEPNGRWMLDKKVPLPMLVMLMIQTGVLIWWAAGMNFKVDQLEKDNLARAPQADRIIRLETKVDGVYDRLSEIKGLLSPTPQRR